MKPSDLQRLIALSQKTGDTLVIAGENDQESVVVMPLARYEALLDPIMSSPKVEVSQETVHVEQEERLPELEDVFEESATGEVIEEVGIPDLPIDSGVNEDFSDEEERFYLEPVE